VCMMSERITHWVDGKPWTGPVGRSGEIFDPATGTVTGHVDFAKAACAAGITRVFAFASLENWEVAAAEALSGPGPVAIWLNVEGRLGQKTPKAPRPMNEQIAGLRQALGLSSLE